MDGIANPSGPFSNDTTMPNPQTLSSCDAGGTNSGRLQHKIIIVRQAAAGSGSGRSHWAAALAQSCDILFPPIARRSRYRAPATRQAADVVVLQLAGGRLISHIKRGVAERDTNWHLSGWLAARSDWI